MIEIRDGMTIGEVYGPAMKIQTQTEADEYWQALTAHRIRGGLSRAETDKLEKANLGYFAGYCDDETRERVERLFNCAHPIFGSIAERGAPTAEEAFAAGVAAGAKRQAKP